MLSYLCAMKENRMIAYLEEQLKRSIERENSLLEKVDLLSAQTVTLSENNAVLVENLSRLTDQILLVVVRPPTVGIYPER